jgi:hypothetical protein
MSPTRLRGPHATQPLEHPLQLCRLPPRGARRRHRHVPARLDRRRGRQRLRQVHARAGRHGPALPHLGRGGPSRPGLCVLRAGRRPRAGRPRRLCLRLRRGRGRPSRTAGHCRRLALALRRALLRAAQAPAGGGGAMAPPRRPRDGRAHQPPRRPHPRMRARRASRLRRHRDPDLARPHAARRPCQPLPHV